MTSNRDKFESAFMLAIDRDSTMKRGDIAVTKLHFRRWRSLPENKKYVQDIEDDAGARYTTPEWRERVATLADQFRQWLARHGP
jgi:hypothetical protein